MKLEILVAILLASVANTSSTRRALDTISGAITLTVDSPGSDLHLTVIGLDPSGFFFQLTPYGLPTTFRLTNGRLSTTDGERKPSISSTGTSPGGVLQKLVWVPSEATGPVENIPIFSAEKVGSGFDITSAFGIPCVRTADPGDGKALEVYLKALGNCGCKIIWRRAILT